MHSPLSRADTILAMPVETRYRGRDFVEDDPPRWPAKDPAEIATRAIDWAALLHGRPILQIQADVVPAGLVTVAEKRFAGSIVALRITGGTAGQTATIAVSIVLSDGVVLRRKVLLPIVCQGKVPPPPPTSITLNTLPLTYAGWSLPPAGSTSTSS